MIEQIEIDELCEKCHNKFGQDFELSLVEEELTELLLAIKKFRRNGNSMSVLRVAEEFADVLLVMNQLKCEMRKVNIGFSSAYMTYFNQKLERVRGLV